MPRKYTMKTNRGQTPIDVLKMAAGALRPSGKLPQSAREFNVSKTTLKRFVDQMSIDEDTEKKSGYKRVDDRHRIFSIKMEEDLANHIKLLSNMFYELSTNKCRRLAFEFAIKNNITIPDNWEKNKIAGIDWFLSFKFKYGLFVRKPEATSLARATACNCHTVGKFFDQLGNF